MGYDFSMKWIEFATKPQHEHVNIFASTLSEIRTYPVCFPSLACEVSKRRLRK